MIIVVGLGPIGGGLARRLLDEGEAVLAVDLDPERREHWALATRAPTAELLDDVPWDEAQSVVVAVRMPDQAHAVLARLRDLAGHRSLGVFVATTMTVSAARELAGYGQTEWRLFEAPVSGGQAAARIGRLTCLVAGPETTQADNALLALLVAQWHRFPAYGDPAAAKLLNNALAAYNLRGMAEATLAAVREGLEPSSFLAVIQSSSGQSFAGERLLTFTENELSLLVKDAQFAAQQWPDLTMTEQGVGLLESVQAAQRLGSEG